MAYALTPLGTASLPSTSTLRLTHVLVVQAMVTKWATRVALVQCIWLQMVQQRRRSSC
jgi:hypothetical protein